MTSANPIILVFDLGGVVVGWSGPRDIQALLPSPLGEAEVIERFRRSDVLRLFELGHVTPEEFAAEFRREWTLSLTPDVFLAHFESWTRGFLPGARDLLTELRARYRLVALSNANELHWARNLRLGVQSLFERSFSSHETGLRKPDPAAYHHVLRELGVQPAEVVFFDDTPENVEAASEVGLQAHRVAGVTELRACLKKLGFL